MNTVKRIFDFPHYQLKNKALSKALSTKQDGKWISISTEEYIHNANLVSRALLKLGIKKGDKIGIISSNNRTEWHVIDIAISQIGAVSVPIYPTISEDDFEFIFKHSKVKFCFVSNEELAGKITKLQAKLPLLDRIYTFDKLSEYKHWELLKKLGEDPYLQKEIEQIKESIKETDLATIIYTSGTTGQPKGVMLSHQNLVQNVMGCIDRIPESVESALSFLPVCHVFERMLLYLYQYVSVEVYFAEGIETISDNLKEIKPDIMSVVPRLLEKVYDKIVLKGSELTGIKKMLFFWAIKVGENYKPFEQQNFIYNFQLKIARKLIFSKWQEALGGNIKVLVSGSAALQARLNTIFNAAGMPVLEGYGLTETSPVLAVNAFGKENFRIGTVGKAICNVKLKIAEDGEILAKGPSIMMGYYENPEKTKEVMTEDGYFHTGDIGEINDGFLKITDRKKEMFKTSGGKYVAPQILETLIKASRFIEQIMVVGEGEKMPCAFIQPEFEFLKSWANKKGIDIGNTQEEMVKHPEVIRRIEKIIHKFNSTRGKWERIKKFELTPDNWTIEGGLLTPTMKLKRKAVRAKYQDMYNKMYNK